MDGSAQSAIDASPVATLSASTPAQRAIAAAFSSIGTYSPFAALQRFGLLSEGLLPRRQCRRQANSCDGFRMPAPSLSSPHAPRSPGRRSKAAREGNRGRVGTPISGRYGDFACSDRAAQVRARGVGANSWGETAPRRGVSKWSAGCVPDGMRKRDNGRAPLCRRKPAGERPMLAPVPGVMTYSFQ